MACCNGSLCATSPSSAGRARLSDRLAPGLQQISCSGPTCSGTSTRQPHSRVNVKSSSDAVAYPMFATPDGLCKDRPRNVAQVRPSKPYDQVKKYGKYRRVRQGRPSTVEQHGQSVAEY